MADKENHAPITRASKKRSTTSSATAQPPTKRKRVPLGELPTATNSALSLAPPSPPKTRARSRARKETIQPPPLPPPDSPPASSGDDPQLCESYASDINCYIRSMEVEPKRRPVANFIETVQKDITANMRGILVDWLVEVAEEYRLVADTLYLTISYVDRFLSVNALSRQKLQLLGVSCMLVASKYEEISPPHVEDFCYITDNTYTKQEVVKMETEVLKFLNFEVGNPTIKTFLRRFMRSSKVDGKYPELTLEFLSNYLAELSLLEYGCVQFLPSAIAASALFVARFTIDPSTHPWNTTLRHHIGYNPSQLKDCISNIHDLQLNRRGSSSFTSIREKYKQHRFQCVSLLAPPAKIPAAYFKS